MGIGLRGLAGLAGARRFPGLRLIWSFDAARSSGVAFLGRCWRQRAGRAVVVQAVAMTQVPLIRASPRARSRRRLSAATRWCNQWSLVADTAVADPPVPSGEPGDGPFDHGSVLAVNRLEFGGLGLPPGGPQQRLVVVDGQVPAGLGWWCTGRGTSILCTRLRRSPSGSW